MTTLQNPLDFEDTVQTQLIAFANEVSNCSDIKKVALVTENLRSKNQSIRLYCAKRLTELGNILGVQRIEDELIPFITDLLLNFEDDGEVLSEFSNQLLNLLIILKKNNIFSFVGIRSLEILSGNDDEIVRHTSIKNLSNLIEYLDEELIKNEIFPLMKRLIENDLKTKMSCCYLFPVVYPKLKNIEIKKELLTVYYDISHDESPSVRRAAADNIKYFCNVNDPEVLNLLIKLYNDFIKDSVDIVKIYTTQSTDELLKKINDLSKLDAKEYLTNKKKNSANLSSPENNNPEQKNENIEADKSLELLVKNPNEAKEKLVLSLTTSMASEKAWRVKYAAAECIAKISENFDQEFFETKFTPLLMLFLKDKEPEVKSAVLSHFDDYSKKLSLEKFKQSFLQIFVTLSNDSNLHVRAVFADAVLKCIPFFKNDEELMKNNIIPILSKLLKDEIIEVQYAAIENLDAVLSLSVNDEDFLNKYILPIIQDGLKNIKWRFRYLIAENLLKVMSKITKDNIEKTFMPIVTELFKDHAEEIRITSWKIFEEIIKICGEPFLKDKIWPIQKEKLSSKNYILRIASLKSIEYLKNYYDINFLKDGVINEIINVVKNDKVPNVKFTCCNTLPILANYLKDGEVTKKIKEFINNLMQDEDQDVKYFGKKALEDLEK